MNILIDELQSQENYRSVESDLKEFANSIRNNLNTGIMNQSDNYINASLDKIDLSFSGF